PHVVSDLVVALFPERLVQPPGDVVEHLIPAHPLPLTAPPRPLALHRVQYPLRIRQLIDRRRPLRAVAPAAAGVVWVALQLADTHIRLVDVSRQPAGTLAVKTGRRHDHVLLLVPPRPRLR